MGPLFDSVSLANANDVAQASPRVMDFLYETAKEKVTKARATEEYASVMTALTESHKVVMTREDKLQSLSEKVWKGEAKEEEIQMLIAENLNFMDIRAMEKINTLNESLGKEHAVSNINMVYYVDETGQFNRGYMVNNQIVDETNDDHKKMLEVIDEMFHSWLVSHRMASDANGIIHKRKANGELGEIVKPKEIRQLLDDPKTGFQTTLKKIDPSIDLMMNWTPPEPTIESAQPTQASSGT